MAPASSLMVDGYVRVSRVGYRSGERFISPSVQREQIAAWAQARPATVLEIWEELDESGGRPDRPLLETAVQRIEQGLSQGLVVASVDRFGRSLLHGLALIERIERAGGSFFSVRDGLDLTTDTGRLVLRIMLAMAEWQLDRLRSSWMISNQRAIARGVFVGSQIPLGYRKQRSGRLRPEPRIAPIITELFARRATGESRDTLAQYLEQHGIRSVYGNTHWQPRMVRQLLANRVYLGEVRWSRWVREGAHPALTDEATWQAAQRPRAPRPSRRGSVAPLAGLLRCASCGMKMHRSGRPTGYYHYTCRRHSAAGECPAPASMTAIPLETCVEDIVLDLLARRRTPPETEVRAAEQQVIRAQQALADYRDSDRVLATLGEQRYAEGLAIRVARLRDAGLKLEAARARRGLHELPPASIIEAQWGEMDVPTRRELIGRVVDCIFVQPGHRHFDDRIWVCPTGTAPRGLTRRGDKHTRIQAYEPRRGWISARYATSRPPRWSHARVERELRVFVRGRTHWPTADVFQSAGRSRLYRQMELHGGEQYWAPQLNLPRKGQAPSAQYEQQVRAALSHYLRDKAKWPSTRQFLDDGLCSLRAAIGKTGGVRRWATEFDIPRTHPRSNGPIVYWTEDRIREQLATLCQGRTTFPSQADFARAGLRGMVAAMRRRNGGVPAWADDYQLPVQQRWPESQPR